jgi:hypothetical protein
MAMSAAMTLSEIVRPSPAAQTALTSCHNYPLTSSSSAPDSGEDQPSSVIMPENALLIIC